VICFCAGHHAQGRRSRHDGKADPKLTNKIRALRFGAREMTKELADRIGLTRQTVHAIELGKYSPSLEVAFKIDRRGLRVPLEDVFQYSAARRPGRLGGTDPAASRSRAARIQCNAVDLSSLSWSSGPTYRRFTYGSIRSASALYIWESRSSVAVLFGHLREHDDIAARVLAGHSFDPSRVRALNPSGCPPGSCGGRLAPAIRYCAAGAAYALAHDRHDIVQPDRRPGADSTSFSLGGRSRAA